MAWPRKRSGIVAVSPDGKLLATGGNDGQVKLWDAATGTPLARSIIAHSAPVTGLAFSPDGSRLFSGSLDKTIRAWQVGDGTALGGINTPAPVNAMAIVSEGAQIAAGGADNLIRVWDIAAATVQPPAETVPVSTLAGHEQPITSLANTPGMPAPVFSAVPTARHGCGTWRTEKFSTSSIMVAR